jgi:hypothetical protein
VAAGTDTNESDAVAVLWIHVGLDLEHETAKRRLVGFNPPLAGIAWQRRRRPSSPGTRRGAPGARRQRRRRPGCPGRLRGAPGESLAEGTPAPAPSLPC